MNSYQINYVLALAQNSGERVGVVFDGLADHGGHSGGQAHMNVPVGDVSTVSELELLAIRICSRDDAPWDGMSSGSKLFVPFENVIAMAF